MYSILQKSSKKYLLKCDKKLVKEESKEAKTRENILKLKLRRDLKNANRDWELCFIIKLFLLI